MNSIPICAEFENGLLRVPRGEEELLFCTYMDCEAERQIPCGKYTREELAGFIGSRCKTFVVDVPYGDPNQPRLFEPVLK